MTHSEIISFFGHWQHHKMLHVGNIQTLGDVKEARKWCSFMRNGVFWDVSDLRMWRALTDMRKAAAQ